MRESETKTETETDNHRERDECAHLLTFVSVQGSYGALQILYYDDDYFYQIKAQNHDNQNGQWSLTTTVKTYKGP